MERVTSIMFWVYLSVLSLLHEAVHTLMVAVNNVGTLIIRTGNECVHWVDVKINGEIRQPVTTFKPGTTTILPEEHLTQDDWLNEYRVSYMHGWRSTPIHIEENELLEK